MIRLSGVDEADGLLTVDLLGEMAMKERVGDVHLVDGPCAGDRQLEDSADSAWFDNRGEGVGEVHARPLLKTTNHPSSLVVLERTVRASLVAKHPLARDDVGTRGSRNKLPCAVAL